MTLKYEKFLIHDKHPKLLKINKHRKLHFLVLFLSLCKPCHGWIIALQVKYHYIYVSFFPRYQYFIDFFYIVLLTVNNFSWT